MRLIGPIIVVGAVQLTVGLAGASFILEDEHVGALEGFEDALDLPVVEATAERGEDELSELVTAATKPAGADHPRFVAEPGAQAIPRIAQEDEELGIGCRPTEQGQGPESVHVARSPLVRDLARRMGHVAVVVVDIAAAERTITAIEEVKLLAGAANPPLNGRRRCRRVPELSGVSCRRHRTPKIAVPSSNFVTGR